MRKPEGLKDSVMVVRKRRRRKGPVQRVRKACSATFLLCDPEQVTVPLCASDISCLHLGGQALGH